MFYRAIIIWVLLSIIAVLNGISRNVYISPTLGEYTGHVISTFILCIIIFLVTVLSIRWINPRGSRDALSVGIFWIMLTGAFEFLAGHYLFGNSWERLLADYNIFQGRIWVLVLLSTLFAPLCADRLRTSL